MKRLFALLTAFILTMGLLAAPLWPDVPFASAAAAPAAEGAPALAAQIANIPGLAAAVSPADPNVINVTGAAAGVSSTVTLNIDPTVTVNWGAALDGATASGRYLLNLAGGGTFNLTGGGALTNGSGLITVTGGGAAVSVGGGARLYTPADGNGISLNVAANNVSVAVGGEIVNNGSNSALNVTAGVTGARITVDGGRIESTPAGYAVNDGGTALCANDTVITVTGGEVTAGSACAIKSTGADSVLIITGGTVKNAATVNSNPVIYMNGGTGDNVTVGGAGTVIASDNNLGYGIQTTGNVLIRDGATVRATSGRAVNLVGMDSVITVDGGLVTATAGVAICTATTNPATVANAKIIVNGGVVSTTDPDAKHGDGRTIYATGEKNEVAVNGGWVYTSSDSTEAIYTAGANSGVTVAGGWVTALNHFAIEAYSGGSVDVSGGFVFAYGDEPVSAKTGANVKNAAIGAVGGDRVTVGGEGVVTAWNRDAWVAGGGMAYTAWEDTDLATAPPALGVTNVYWDNNGGSPGGVAYASGGNSGFFPIALVARPRFHVTVLNGAGSGVYAEKDSVTVTADAPPAGKEFAGWLTVSGGVTLGASPAESFDMPGADVTVMAAYTDILYALTVVNGSGGGSYAAGTQVTVTAGPAPAGKAFDHWENGGAAFSNSVTAVFTMPAGDATVTAVYRDIPYAFTLQGGTVASASAPADANGKYPAGTVITINTFSAFPPNYSFSGWAVVSGGGTFMDNDAFAPLHARFVMPAADSVVSMCQPYYSGTAAGHTLAVLNGVDLTHNGPYGAGQDVSIQADPAPEGKVFAGWVINAGRGIFADAGAASTLFRMSDADATVRAVYADIAYPLRVEYGEIAGGAFAGQNAGRFIAGEVASLTAVAPEPGKYKFEGWTFGGGGVLASPSGLDTAFTMPMGPAVATAHWLLLYGLQVAGGVIVEVNGQPVDGGVASGYFEAGDRVKISKTGAPPPDYEFSGWQSNNGGVFDDPLANDTVFTMPANDAAVTAEYAHHQAAPEYILTVVGGECSGDGGVTWQASQTIKPGATADLRADPADPGHLFAGWAVQPTNGGTLTGLGQPNLNYGAFGDASLPATTFTMPDQDVTVTAAYKPLYTLTVRDGSDGSVIPLSPDRFLEGARVEITAPDHDGMAFTGWAVTGGGGSFVSAHAVKTVFIMPGGDAEVTAAYAAAEKIYYSLTTVNCHGDKHGPFAENGAETVTVTADTPSGKRFARWAVSGIDAPADPANPVLPPFVMPNNNVTVEAVLEDAEYALAVVNGTGAGSYAAGTHVTVTADPPPAGKVFDKWVSGNGGAFADSTAAQTEFVMPANAVTVTAGYADTPYTFTLQGGTVASASPPAVGGKYLAGTVITINTFCAFPPGYSFGGWTVVSGGGTFMDNDAFAPFRARFVMPAADSVVSMCQPYYGGGGGGHVLTVLNGVDLTHNGPYGAGRDVSIQADPAPEGKTFAGWVVSAGRGVFADAGAASTLFRMSDADATVRAVYADIAYPLLVEYGEIAGGAFAGQTAGRFITGANISLTAVAPESGKYKFDGWTASGGVLSDASAYATGFTMPMGPAVATAHWNPLHALQVDGGVIVEVNGQPVGGGPAGEGPVGEGPVGEGPVSGYFEAGDRITVAERVPGPDGYTFTGWHSDGGGAFDGPANAVTTYTMPPNDATVFAGYVHEAANPVYTLTVEGGTGSTDGGLTSWASQALAPGSAATLTADAPPPGAAFAGWAARPTDENDGGNGAANPYNGSLADASAPVTAFIMPGRDVTVAAAYKPLYTLMVRDGSDGSVIPLSPDRFLEGARVEITAPDHDGMVFTGWAVTGGGGSFVSAHAVKTVFIMPGGDAEVTAAYAAAEKIYYSLTTVNCHGDKHGPFAENGAETVTVTADTPSGKRFARWAVTDGVAYVAAPANPAKITFTMPNNNVAVEAVLEDAEYALTVVNGTGAGSYAAGTHVTVTADPPPAGKVFDKWVSGNGGMFADAAAQTTEFVMPANAVTVTAGYADANTPVPPPVPAPTSRPTPRPVPTPAPTPTPAPLPGDVSHLLNTGEHMAYARGGGDGLFAPDRALTRADLAQLFYDLLLNRDIKAARGFADVPEGAWYEKAVGALAALGVVTGRPDGLFHPGDPVTRAEFVTAAVRFAKEALGDRPPSFPDVPDPYWAHDSIVTAAGYGWIHGDGDGLFHPDRHMTRADAVTLANTMLGRVPDRAYIDSHPELLFYADVPKTHWAFYDIAEASNTHGEIKQGDGEEWQQWLP